MRGEKAVERCYLDFDFPPLLALSRKPGPVGAARRPDFVVVRFGFRRLPDLSPRFAEQHDLYDLVQLRT